MSHATYLGSVSEFIDNVYGKYTATTENRSI